MTTNPLSAPPADLDSLTPDDLRDEVGRLLALLATLAGAQPLPAPKRHACAKRAPLPEVFGTDQDPRLPTNTRPHFQIPYQLPSKLTPGKAQAIRTLGYQTCGCRLCALALRPPLTFEDSARFQAFDPSAWPPTDSRAVLSAWRSRKDGKNPNQENPTDSITLSPALPDGPNGNHA